MRLLPKFSFRNMKVKTLLLILAAPLVLATLAWGGLMLYLSWQFHSLARASAPENMPGDRLQSIIVHRPYAQRFFYSAQCTSDSSRIIGLACKEEQHIATIGIGVGCNSGLQSYSLSWTMLYNPRIVKSLYSETPPKAEDIVIRLLETHPEDVSVFEPEESTRIVYRLVFAKIALNEMIELEVIVVRPDRVELIGSEGAVKVYTFGETEASLWFERTDTEEILRFMDHVHISDCRRQPVPPVSKAEMVRSGRDQRE